MSDKPKDLVPLSVLEEFPDERYNKLLPTHVLQAPSEIYRYSPEIVQIDPVPARGEVYPLSSEKSGDGWIPQTVALAKRGLEKIAHAAGIVMDPSRSGIEYNDGTRVVARATGGIRKPDGSWIVISKTKEIDLEASEEEEREKLMEKAERGQLVSWTRDASGRNRKKVLKAGTPECDQEIERRVRKQMIQLRKHKVARADTGAHERLIRSLLAIKSEYTPAELAKPFVVPRIQFNEAVALADPELRRELVRNAMAASNAVFGQAAPPSLPPTRNGEPQSVPRLSAPTEELAETPMSEEAESEMVDKETGEIAEDKDVFISEWASASEHSRHQRFLDEVERTSFDLASVAKGEGWKVGGELVTSFSQLSPQAQARLLWRLKEMPTRERRKIVPQEDLPF